MRYNRILTMAVAAAGGLLVAACGNDAEALSKPEFIAQANAICEASNDEIDSLFEGIFDESAGFDPDDPASEELIFLAFAEVMGEAGPIFERQLDDIRDLEPPAEDKDLIDTLIDDQEAALAELTEMLDDAAAGDEAARTQIESDEDQFADVNRRARDYGLTECGEDD